MIKMGLLEAVRAKNTTEEGMMLIDTTGKTRAAFPASTNGLTAELEILRGDLAEVLYDATKNDTRYIFGDSIKDIDDSDDAERKAVVTFNSGKSEAFDYVIIADGVRSWTRKMVFGDEVQLRRVGLCKFLISVPPRLSETF